MSVTKLKDEDFEWHAGQVDVPQKSAAEMKDFFDTPSKKLMEKVNEIIDDGAQSLTELVDGLCKKQNTLKAGDGIKIEGDTIYASDKELTEEYYSIDEIPLGLSVAKNEFLVRYTDMESQEIEEGFNAGTAVLCVTNGELRAVYFIPPHIQNDEEPIVDDYHDGLRGVLLRNFGGDGRYLRFADDIISVQTIQSMQKVIDGHSKNITEHAEDIVDLKDQMRQKQDELTAGDGISIKDNVISALGSLCYVIDDLNISKETFDEIVKECIDNHKGLLYVYKKYIYSCNQVYMLSDTKLVFNYTATTADGLMKTFRVVYTVSDDTVSKSSSTLTLQMNRYFADSIDPNSEDFEKEYPSSQAVINYVQAHLEGASAETAATYLTEEKLREMIADDLADSTVGDFAKMLASAGAIVDYVDSTVDNRTQTIKEDLYAELDEFEIMCEDRIIGLQKFKSAVADYVTETGTDGVWSYRKWASGEYDAWCKYDVESVSTTELVGGIYVYSAEQQAPSFSKSITTCLSDNSMSGTISWGASNFGENYIWHRTFASTEASDVTLRVCLRINGKWK